MSVFGGIPLPDGDRPHEPYPENEKQKLGIEDEASTASTHTRVGRDKDEGDREQEKDMEGEIQEMARQLTRHSTHFSTSNAKNPFFEEDKETTWHPDSANFNTRDWIRSLLAAQSADPERFRQRRAGVALKNLNVHGFGSPTDFQKDVLNSILKVGDLARYFTGTGKQKVQILQGFDGLVRSGEMLVVLGRPGRYAIISSFTFLLISIDEAVANIYSAVVARRSLRPSPVR